MGMTPDLHRRQPAGLLMPMRRARWFGWLVLVAAVCTVGLYALEAAHTHKTLAGELHCPVCQVMAHSALEVFTPRLDAKRPLIHRRFLRIASQQTFPPRPVPGGSYQPRAPPAV